MTALLAERPTTWGEGLPSLTGTYPVAVNVWTDMPAGLTDDERAAYVRGYAKGALAYVRKHGGPGAAGDELATITREQMTARRLTHEAERQPAAHRAGLSAVRAWIKKHGSEERAEILKPAKPRKLAAVPDVEDKPARKPRKAKAVPDVVTAAVQSGRLTIVRARTAATDPAYTTYPEARAARKSARRELADQLRSAGIRPTGEAWETAKREAGLS